MAQNEVSNQEFARQCRLDDHKQQLYSAESGPNNNDHAFQSQYGQRQVASASDISSGRSSRGSDESSVILSTADDSEHDSGQFYDSVSDFSSASGRSSADNQTTEAAGPAPDVSQPSVQLNKTRNLVPRLQQVLDLVDQVRLRFLHQLEENQAAQGDRFEQLDLEEMRRGLPKNPNQQDTSLAFRLISRYFNFNHLLKRRKDDAKLLDDKELDEVVEKLVELLEFRRQYQLTRITGDQFCKEFYQMNGLFRFGYDRNQLPVIYIRARIHRKWSPRLDDTFRRYVAWQIDSITKSYAGADVSETIGRNGIEKDGSFGICFDCLHVSYSCLDMDFLKFLVKILVNYYPTYCRYALCVDLPWLFRSVWKLVRSWLPEEAQNTVQLITSKQLTDFISEDQIPNSIQYNDMSADEKPKTGKHKLPEDWNSIRAFDELATELKLTSSEIKQFKSHFAKVIKEYEQLGAI